MKQHLKILLLVIIFLSLLNSCSVKAQDEFDRINGSASWKPQLSDPCTTDWQSNWFLDGLEATIEHSDKGMNFSAGKINREDAHHGVLWTKESFTGDIKIEYNYTKTDTQKINVNILYIQATGIGKQPYDKDISKWNDLRTIPTMSKYYNNMNAIHISYAAFPMVSDDSANDYIRVRKYPISEENTFGEIEVPPVFYNTGLFLTNVTYKVVWIKSGIKLYLWVEGNNESKKYAWDLPKTDPITEGRIGLRHMFTRSANYSDFKVYVKN